MALRVTAKWLEKMGACEEQVELFKETFPRGAAVTLKNLRKAVKAGLNEFYLVDQGVPEYARKAADTAWMHSDIMCEGDPEWTMTAIKAMIKKGRKKLG